MARSTKSGEVEGVQTSNNILCCRKTVVIAAGAWSGSLDRILMNTETGLNVPVKPRKVGPIIKFNCAVDFYGWD